jgi:hypothetical protein
MPTPITPDDLYPWDPAAPQYITTRFADSNPVVPLPGLPCIILSMDLPYVAVSVLTENGTFENPRILDTRDIKFARLTTEFVERITAHIRSSPHEYPPAPVLPRDQPE